MPFAMLVGLVAFSIPWIRHRFYESFYWMHGALSVCYLGLCFWHFGNIGDSWTYLYATVGIWLFGLLGRMFWKNQAFRVDTKWPSSFPTTIRSVAGGIIRVDVYLPPHLSWQPGQHFYLRFPFLSPLDNHPFTIANIPQQILEKASEETAQKATFLARPHGGFTRKLASYAQAQVNADIVQASVWLERPYGGITRNVERRCDNLILIAGGSGITACLSWLLHCTRAMSAGEGALQRVKLIWIVREREHVQWITEELDSAKAMINGDERLELTFYVTRSNAEPTGVEESKAAATKTDASGCVMYRPSIAAILPGLLGTGRNMIIGRSFPCLMPLMAID